MKVTILAEKDLVQALQRYLSYARIPAGDPITIVNEEENPNLLVVEGCFPAIKLDEIYPGLKWGYSHIVEQMRRRNEAIPILLLSHEDGPAVVKLLETVNQLEKDIRNRPPKKFQNWENELKNHLPQLFLKVPCGLPDLIGELKSAKDRGASSFDFLAAILRNYLDVRHPHPKSQILAARSTKFLFCPMPWNVLVIDNDLEGELRDQLLLNKVLAYPDNEFWRGGDSQPRFNAICFYPEELLTQRNNQSIDERIKKFNVQLTDFVFRHDVDLILLDVALKDYAGFYLVEEIRGQLFKLGRHWVPIIMFSKYKETEYIVTSISRGANWYASKFEEEPSWVGLLGDVIAKVSTSQLWFEEYKLKYLSMCDGSSKDKLQNDDTHDIPFSEFQLHDPFFGTEPPNSFGFITESCLHEKLNGRLNLDKLREFHYIFRRLFGSFDSVELLESSTAGFSGTNVFYVRPIRQNIQCSVQIVKIGPYAEIAQERLNFDEWINGVLDSFTGRIKVGPIRASEYAGLLYVAVGVKEDYAEGKMPVSLKKFIIHAVEEKELHGVRPTPKILANFIERIFLKVLSCFYIQEQNNPKGHRSDISETSPLSLYIDDLPSSLSGQIVAIHTNPGEGRASIEKKNDPGWVYSKKWDGTKEETFQGISQVDQVHDVSPDQTYYLLDFEVYEIDRSKKELKLYNRYLNWVDTKSRDEATIRVDLDCDDQVFEKFLADPRFEKGKRVGVLAQNLQKVWKTDKLKFLHGKNTEKADPTYVDACRKALISLDMQLHGEMSENRGEFSYKLLEIFGKHLQDGSLSKKRRFTMSIIHGDLNLDNILVTLSADQPLGWFIDFRRSRPGHVAYDFVKLETEIKTHILSRYLKICIEKMEMYGIPKDAGIRGWLEWFFIFEREAVIENAKMPGMVKSKYLEQDWNRIRRVAELLLLLRELAAQHGLAGEYNWGLFFYSLTALKFSNLNDRQISNAPPLPKCLAYVSACSAYQKLNQTDPILKRAN